MRRFARSEKSIPVLFAAITLLGYGLLLPYTGFHWDDWGFAWIARFLGPAEFIPAFQGFRPFLGPIFSLTTGLIPPHPLYWQVLALAVRFAIGLSAWWTFKSIWPGHPRLALTLALFMLVFPGYSQHWVALTHINQELIPFICYLLSLGVTAHAIRHLPPFTGHSPLATRRSPPSTLHFPLSTRYTSLTLLALLLQFIGLFPTEYFFGLEPLRLLFIWSMLEEHDFKRRARGAIRLWLPHLMLWLADAAWLLILYRSEAYVSYGISGTRDLSFLGILTALADAVFKAGLYAWGQILFLTGSTLPAPASLLTLGLVAVTFAFTALYLFRLTDLQSTNSQSTNSQSPPPTFHSPLSSPLFLLLIGLAGIILGRLPSLAAGLPLTLGSTFDRFMISMTLGGSLFFAGLIELLFRRNERARMLALSLVVALGVGQQFYNANLFRRDWARQQEIYWQFAWRMPAIQPGTLILTDQIRNMPFETDLSFTAPVNWIYAPEYTGGNLPYALLYTEARLGGGTLPELKDDLPVTVPFRTVSFHGSTAAAVVILVPENGCLRVLDPALGDVETYEKQSRFLLDAIQFSDPSRIVVDAAEPNLPLPPFSREPEHAWCYYYEKAELARQTGDWQAIVDLARQAESSGHRPEDVFEWLPFIEAYARTGDVDQAMSLSRASFQDAARLRKGLCHVWKRIQAGAEGGSDVESGGRQMFAEFDCAP